MSDDTRLTQIQGSKSVLILFSEKDWLLLSSTERPQMDEARLTATPPGVKLCPLDAIADPGARAFVLQLRAGRFHGFVVRQGGAVAGFVDRCPHMGLPLAQTLDDYMAPSGDLIACSWHGALFDAASGRCVAGPCQGASLLPWPVCVSGPDVYTAAAV